MHLIFIFYVFHLITATFTTITSEPTSDNFIKPTPTSSEVSPLRTKGNKVYSRVEYEDTKHRKILGWLLVGGLAGAAMAGGRRRHGGSGSQDDDDDDYDDDHDYDYYYDSKRDYGYHETLTWIKKKTTTVYKETYTKYLVVDALTRYVSDNTTFYSSAATLVKSSNEASPNKMNNNNKINSNWTFLSLIFGLFIVFWL